MAHKCGDTQVQSITMSHLPLTLCHLYLCLSLHLSLSLFSLLVYFQSRVSLSHSKLGVTLQAHFPTIGFSILMLHPVRCLTTEHLHSSLPQGCMSIEVPFAPHLQTYLFQTFLSQHPRGQFGCFWLVMLDTLIHKQPNLIQAKCLALKPCKQPKMKHQGLFRQSALL